MKFWKRNPPIAAPVEEVRELTGIEKAEREAEKLRLAAAQKVEEDLRDAIRARIRELEAKIAPEVAMIRQLEAKLGVWSFQNIAYQQQAALQNMGMGSHQGLHGLGALLGI